MKTGHEQPTGPVGYFVRTWPGAAREPTHATAWGSLEEALRAAQRAAPPDDSPGETTEVEISCAQAGAPVSWAGKPYHRFFIATPAFGEGGDGSELAPWWSTSYAIEQLMHKARTGEVELRPGERWRLCWRGVFTPSGLERGKRLREWLAQIVFLAMTLTLIVPILALLGYLVVRAWPALSIGFLLENPKDYMTAGGIWAPLVGTFFLVFFSLLVAAPVGILAGIYLQEYAPENWATRLINLAVVNLAGVPSIVHALFGVGAFVLFAGMGRSVLAASCTLAVMTLPVIITSTREALDAVPKAFREACWNLGASRWQTIRTIVLPNAMSGILTGVILQVSRAAGETAPILFTGAVFYVPVAEHGWAAVFPYGPWDRCMALSMHLFTLMTQVRGVSDEVQYATAVVLIGLVLAVNSLSLVIRAYLRMRKRW